MDGIGTNKAVNEPKARVLAGGGKLSVTTKGEENCSAGIDGVFAMIASMVELNEAEEAVEPKNKVY